jgi:hypothetical protein
MAKTGKPQTFNDIIEDLIERSKEKAVPWKHEFTVLLFIEQRSQSKIKTRFKCMFTVIKSLLSYWV